MYIQVLKFMKNANEYRFFPITMDVDVCVVFKTNNFGIMEFLHDFSNIRTCYLKKVMFLIMTTTVNLFQGFYYIHNGMLNDSKLPPNIPRGNYKVEIQLHSNNEFVADLYVVGEVVDKSH
ncbi:hypothetical protein ILUMI_09091 [Ignelater luminosus]|uniref:Uncharacterized protein n=1 Tax=Ignelater luminosus TaxID=2038154 RepID=A0A8K0D0N2_IGNLU|nr:hypothetical protein ILUMI_09091 [Ignelater luminosus]